MNNPTYRNNIGLKNNALKSVSQNTQDLILAFGKATLLVLMIIFVVYVLYYTYIYYSIPCASKIPYFQYLTNFGSKAFCNLNPMDPLKIEEDKNEEEEEEKSSSTSSLSKSTSTSTSASTSMKDEVFQISNQTFSWDEAKCKCEAYGARLATKAELTEAYNQGAHWCNYGWIDGSEAYYPVQQCELDRKAQNIRDYNTMLKKHYEDPQKYTLQMLQDARNKMERENSTEFCGNRPGLNGGYFEDKKLRFGATCFGKKPAGMSIREKSATCEKSDAEKKREAEEAKSAAKKCDGKSATDVIASFNLDKWNR